MYNYLAIPDLERGGEGGGGSQKAEPASLPANTE